MSHGIENPLQHPEVQLANGRGYLIAYAVCVMLMALTVAVVTKPGLLPSALVGISVLAAVAVGVQVLLLFQLNFSQTQIWSTVSFILIVPLFVIAVGFTIWMFDSLTARTMVTSLMH